MTKKDRASPRLYYIDSIRVFATLCVIVLHCIYNYFNNPVNYNSPLWALLGYVNEVCRVGVPLFFMISGYLTMKRPITDIPAFYKKRFIRIGVPFIIYDVFYYFVSSANMGEPFSLNGYLKGLLNSGNKYHLWFVYSILFLYLIAPFLQKMLDACSNRQLYLLLCLATFQTTLRPLLNLFLHKADLNLFFTSDGFMGYVGYFILGYILGVREVSPYVKKAVYYVAMLAFFMSPIITAQQLTAGDTPFFMGGYTANHYVEGAAVFLFFKDRNRPTHLVTRVLSDVSFTAYLIHVFVIELILKLSFDSFYPWQMMLIVIAASTALSFIWGLVVKFTVILIRYIISLPGRQADPGLPDKRLR